MIAAAPIAGIVAGSLVLATGTASAAQTIPLVGCYERVYDAAHLSAHRGQIVARAMLCVSPAPAEIQTGAFHPIIAQGNLKIWLRGRTQSFDSLGACWSEGSGLNCSGSLSAAEVEIYRSKRDGIRQCRMRLTESGSFRIAARPDGALVTVAERLERVPAAYDQGPFLSLSPNDTENHVFRLETAPGICK